MTRFAVIRCARVLAAFSLCATLAGGGGPARADSPSAASFGAYARGLALRSAGETDDAVKAFIAALSADASAGSALIALLETYAAAGRDSELIQAASTYTKARRSPDSLSVALLVAGASARQGDRTTAIRELQGVVDAAPDSAPFRLLLAEAYADAGDAVRALGEYRQAARCAPEDPGVLSALGSALAATDSLDAAREAFGASLAFDPDQPEVESAIGVLEQESGRFAAALRHYDRVLEFLPGEPATQLRRSECMAALGRIDESAAVLESLRRVVRSPAVLDRRLAVLFWRADRPAAARKYAKALRAQDASDPLPDEILGYLAMDEGKIEDASRHFRSSLSKAPGSGATQLALGVTLLRLKRPAEALAALRDARQNGGNPTAALYFSGLGLLGVGDTTSAIDTLSLAHESDSLQSGPAFALAQIADARGDRPTATRWMRRVIMVDSTNAFAWNYVGYMQADAGVNLGEALAQIRQALTLEPDNGAFLDSYGWVLYRLGRLEEARAALEEATKREPREGEIFEHLGDVYVAMGRTDAAMRSYQQAARARAPRRTAEEKARRLGGRVPALSGNP